MANFIALVDGNIERRQRFLQRVRAEIAPVDGLRTGGVGAGAFAAVWAAQDRAPISSRSEPTRAAVVWGDAIPGPGPDRLDAAGLLRAWEPSRSETPAAFDGFHAAVRYDDVHGLALGADVLGLFPIYYAADGDTLVAGSSPELFRHHPLFPARVSPRGLAGILLAHALLDGRALLSGVHRLGPGHVLSFRAGVGPREVPQYAIPLATPVPGSSFRDHVEQLDEAFAHAIDRHVPRHDEVGVLLSGGRDSRQLAGYLRERGDQVIALTLGMATDHEMACAKRVARTLEFAHRAHDLGEADFTAGALRQAKWEHLGTGFSSIHMWGAVAPLCELPSRFVSGHLRAVREAGPPAAADGLVRGDDHRGIDASVLRRLLRAPVFDGVVDCVERKLREAYESSCAIETQRAWRFYVAHGSRAHAGAVPWRLSFGSWPVLPILDRNVLAVISALPDSSLGNRRAQDEILRRRFRHLARLPLDRNADDTAALLPSAGQQIVRRVKRAVEPIRRRMPHVLERRYYHRLYNINGPEWRAVRRLAEPHRERIADLFAMDVVAELLPPPDTPIAVEHTIRDTFGRKMLIGLLLWSADHPC